MTVVQLTKLLNFYKAEMECNHNVELLKAEHLYATLEKDGLSVNSICTTDINEYINEIEKLICHE